MVSWGWMVVVVKAVDVRAIRERMAIESSMMEFDSERKDAMVRLAAV